MAKQVNPQYVVVMKAGPYCGFSLDEIIRIKQKEDKSLGKFFWGYSGVFCHPKVLQSFVSHAQSNGSTVKLLFPVTKSAYDIPAFGRFTEYSHDKAEWSKLPEEVLLVGRKEKAHFAVTGNKLEKVDIELNLADYCTLSGMFPNEDRYLDQYIKYRVDKACGYYLPRKDIPEKTIEIGYSCELVDPFSVYIQ